MNESTLTLWQAAGCAGTLVLLMVCFRRQLARLFGFARRPARARRPRAACDWGRPAAAGCARSGLSRAAKLPKFNFRSRFGGSWLMCPGGSATADLASPAIRGVCPAFGLLSFLVAALFSGALLAQGACAATKSRGQGASRSSGTGPRQAAVRALQPPRFTLRALVRGALLALVLLTAGSAYAGTVNVALLPVGDAGNVADSRTGLGSVAYPYSLGEYDVTMGQYAAFLNAVATTADPYGLYNASMAHATPTYGIAQTSTSAGYVYALVGNSVDVPVTYTNWGSAARFVNWLQNGEPSGLGEVVGSTETGTYALNGSTGSAALMAVTRSTTATWVLPTANEWYKAAYYVGGGTNAGYWNFPTQNNNEPSYVLSATGTNNGNYTVSINTPPFTTSSDPKDWLTPVGAFVDSPAPYGSYDMGGDVWQWTETAEFAAYDTGRVCFAGSWASSSLAMIYSTGNTTIPTYAGGDTGFRVAAVPEPSAAALLLFGAFVIAVFAAVSEARARKFGKKGASEVCRPRLLRGEPLEARQMLSAWVEYDPNASGAWETRDWLDLNNNSVPVSWGSLTAPIKVKVINVPANGNSPPEITIQSTVSGVSEIDFEQPNCTITGGTLSLNASNPTMTVDVFQNDTAEIDSAITGATGQVKKDDFGALILTGPVTVGSLIDTDAGTLALNGSTTITNGDNSGYGLQVLSSATITGTGPLVLQDQTVQTTPTPLYYDSSSMTSVYTGPISGQGGIDVEGANDSPTVGGLLTIGCSLNSYSGGTTVNNGPAPPSTVNGLQLMLDSATGGPATLGTAGVTIGNFGMLNLNGCSLTVPLLNGADGAAIHNVLTGTGSGPAGVAVLTVDIAPSALPCKYLGGVGISAVGTEEPIRFVKMGQGELDISSGGPLNAGGGCEIDAGTVKLVSDPAGAGTYPALDINGGALDLDNFVLVVSQLDGTGGAIIDSVWPPDTTYASGGSALTVITGTPSVFGGSIDLPGVPSDPTVLSTGLYVEGTSSLTVTGSIGTSSHPCNVVVDSLLQIGDGRSSQTNGSLYGVVTVDSANGLTFDVAAGPAEDFNGMITADGNPGFGSILKIWDGNLVMAPEEPHTVTPAPDTYNGAMRVAGGTLTLGNADALAAGTPLIVDDGAEVNMDGNPNAAVLTSVTLNNGSIVSTDVHGNVLSATLTTNESFNLASGTTGAGVTLAGPASLNKRTDGTVTIDGISTNLNYSGGTFNDNLAQGQLIYSGSRGAVALSSMTLLYWNPPAGVTTWDNNSSDLDWYNASTQTQVAWPGNDPTAAQNDVTQNYVAVFNTGGTYTVTVTATVEPCSIEFTAGNVTIQDDGYTGSEILVPDQTSVSESQHQSLVVSVDSGATATMTCLITGNGSLTKEGAGTLVLGTGGSGGTQNSYIGGTFVDAGTVQIGSAGALGSVSYTGQSPNPDSADLTVDDTGVVDLNGQGVTVSSLNSSYAALGAPNGLVTTDFSGPAQLEVDVGSTPGLFAGSVVDGSGRLAVSFFDALENVNTGASRQGLVETLTGTNTYTGGTSTTAALQIGDGTTDGSITGAIRLLFNYPDVENEVIFDVAAGTTEVFDGNISGASSIGGGLSSVVLTGGGTLDLTGDTLGGANGNHFSALRVEYGTLQMGDGTSLFLVSTLFVDAGGTLDLNGNSPNNAIGWVALYGGSIIDSTNGGATIDATDLVELESGAISADLSGAATLLKSDDPVGTTIASVAGTAGLTGNTDVVGGTLGVDGTLRSPSVYVSVSGVLAGSGTCTGGVFIDPDGTGGTLALGAEGGTFTLAALTLQSGCTVTDNIQASAMVLAKIGGTLAINGATTVNFVETGGDDLAVYQELFQYNSFDTTQFGNLTLGTHTGVPLPTLIDDAPNASIDIAFGTALFWTDGSGYLGGSGTWDGLTTSIHHWSTTPDGLSQGPWTNGDIAVFAGAQTSSLVTVADSFTAQPAAIVFLSGGYTIANSGSASPGQLAISQSRILTEGPWTAAINAKVTCTTTLVTSGPGTVTLTNADNLQPGVAVREGKTVVTSSSVIPDGANLYIGANVATVFSTVVPADESLTYSSGLPAGGYTIDVAAGFDANSAIAARVAARNAAQIAAEAAQAAVLAQYQASAALARQRLAAGLNAVNAIADEIDPGNTVHSQDVILSAFGIMFDGIYAAVTGNGGTRAGLSAAAIVDSTLAALQDYSATAAIQLGNQSMAAPNGDVGATADYSQVSDALMQFFTLCN